MCAACPTAIEVVVTTESIMCPTPPNPNASKALAVALLCMSSACVDAEQRLSQTPLYDDITTKTLADDVETYVPRFALWSDGLQKNRFVRLPPGERIDTSDMDAWRFPAGTEFYKEFMKDGRRLETRLQRKEADGSWTMVAYIWDDDESDATLAPLGGLNLHGSAHDSPAVWDCAYCHGASTKPLGFSAVQLSHDDEGITLDVLADRNLLTQAPPSPIRLPGDALDQAVLGALHVNCGSCHSDGGELSNLDLRLALQTDTLRAVEETPMFRTTVDVELGAPLHGKDVYIRRGRPDDSLIVHRMSNRGSDVQMPPIATDVRDERVVSMLEEWIRRLDDNDEGGQP